MGKHRSNEYQYPCAVIRGNELTLLSAADLARVADAASMQAAMSILHEFGYGDGKELANPRDFEAVLAAEQARVAELVLGVIPEREELAFLQFPVDYHNAKVILKAEALGTDPADYLMEGGRMAGAEMAVMVKERNFLFMEAFLRDSILETIEAYGKTRDPQEIDILLDKACYKEMLKEAEAAGNDFVTGYVKLLIDISNVQTFVRVKQIGKPAEFLGKVFLEGGRIDLATLMELYGETYQQIGEKLDLYGFGEAVGRGAAEAAAGGSYALMEKLCDNLKVRYAKGAQFITAGIEPIAAFYVAKEMELKNLRMVLTGKLVGIPEETLKERLREAYV